LSTRAAEASLQTEAFATSTIVQMIARLDEVFINSLRQELEPRHVDPNLRSAPFKSGLASVRLVH